MTKYFSVSSSGKVSGVSGYELSPTSILVQFTTGKKYLYTYNSAGSTAIETMKGLAVASSGLNTYINKNKPGFE